MKVSEFQNLAGGKADIRSKLDGTSEAIIFGGDRNIAATRILFDDKGEAERIIIPNSGMSGSVHYEAEGRSMEAFARMAGQPASWALAHLASQMGQTRFNVDDTRGAEFSTKTHEGARKAVDALQAGLAEKARVIPMYERLQALHIPSGPKQ